MVNRRIFLTSILGTTAAALILPDIERLSIVSADTLTGPAWLRTYREAHEAAFVVFRRLMADQGIVVTRDALPFVTMGTRCADFVVNHQRSIMVPSGEEVSTVDTDRCITPAMRAMVKALVFDGVDRFTSLPVDLPGCPYADTIGPLRMVTQYDMSDDKLTTRFDVVGGASPRGLARVRLRRADNLKRAIRRRLGTYPSASRLV